MHRQIYRDSQGNHCFPLLAAHGAVWAERQYRFGMQLGRYLAWQYAWSARRRREQLARLAEFCDALREINRRMCVHTYVQFHLTRRFRHHPDIGEFVTERIFRPLCLVHEACEMNRRLTGTQKRMVFEEHFYNEQDMIVGDAVTEAVAAFDWPLVRLIALRPTVHFAYMPPGKGLHFTNLGDREDRIRNGLLAFDAAAAVGWRKVEESLGVLELPKCFARDYNSREIAEVAV